MQEEALRSIIESVGRAKAIKELVITVFDSFFKGRYSKSAVLSRRKVLLQDKILPVQYYILASGVGLGQNVDGWSLSCSFTRRRGM
jgi:hypothetical protein